jgi:ribosomal protein S18 acetylase RimI-like enzyme
MSAPASRDPRGSVRMAWLMTAVMGSGCLHRGPEREGHIAIGIRPSVRRQGHGSTLLRGLLGEAERLGIAAAQLWISDDNTAALMPATLWRARSSTHRVPAQNC